jgi:chromosome segregation ATPase
MESREQLEATLEHYHARLRYTADAIAHLNKEWHFLQEQQTEVINKLTEIKHENSLPDLSFTKPYEG